MRLSVLGCSGSIPGPGSPASGYLVEAEGFRLVLDLGHGALGALQRHLRPAEIDAVVLSHLHPDHCLDMTALAVAFRFGGPGYRRDTPLPVIGPAGTRARLESGYDPVAHDPAGRSLGFDELFAFQAPVDGAIGPFEVSYARMNHPPTTHAIAVRHGGRTLVYSGDTGESVGLVALARDADVLLCEASFRAGEAQVPDLHLTGRQAGEHATRAGVGRLVVTHVPPWNSARAAGDEAGDTFDGPVDVATAGAVYDI